MRLLLLLRDTSPNGITTYNRILARELVAQGHEVHVWPARSDFGAGRALRLPPAHPLLAPLARPWLKHGLKPDLLFVNSYTQARFAHQLKASAGIPWLACMHNGHSPERMALWLQLFGNADGVVTMCETLRASYARLIADGGAAHQPPVLGSRLPMEMPVLRERRADGSASPSPGRSQEGLGPLGGPTAYPQAGGPSLTLGYCSRLSGHKGPRCEAWLEAIARLPGRERYRVLVIGGGSHLKALQAKAAALGLNAEFSGMVADPAPLLERIDVITGAGYALMEGLMRGCAAVGLGFGGCIGAITEPTLDEAYALNFGDHCPRAYPGDADSIAAALATAIASLQTPGLARLHQRARAFSAPAPVVRELVDFMGAALPRAR